MSAISQLLTFDASNIDAPKLFPKGDFKCKISKAEFINFYWDKSTTYGIMYVPEIEVVDYIPSGSEAMDKKVMAELEKFGDWQGFKRQFARTSDKVPSNPGEKVRIAGIANNLNFPLFLTDAGWENVTEQHPQLSRFYLPADKSATGRPRGFVVDVLKMKPAAGISLAELVQQTEGKFLQVTFDHRESEGFDPQLEVKDTQSV